MATRHTRQTLALQIRRSFSPVPLHYGCIFPARFLDTPNQNFFSFLDLSVRKSICARLKYSSTSPGASLRYPERNGGLGSVPIWGMGQDELGYVSAAGAGDQRIATVGADAGTQADGLCLKCSKGLDAPFGSPTEQVPSLRLSTLKARRAATLRWRRRPNAGSSPSPFGSPRAWPSRGSPRRSAGSGHRAGRGWTGSAP